MGANPERQWRQADGADLQLPDFTELPGHGSKSGRRERHRLDGVKLGRLSARYLHAPIPTNFRLFCPDETNSNRLGAVFEVSDRCLVSERSLPDRRPCLA